MKSIINEIYYGNINGQIILPKTMGSDKEQQLYNKLIEKLNKEDIPILDAFLTAVMQQVSLENCKIYKKGFITGFMLAIDIFEEDK